MKLSAKIRSSDDPEQRAANIAAVLWTGGDPRLIAEQTDAIARVLRAYQAIEEEARHGKARR